MSKITRDMGKRIKFAREEMDKGQGWLAEEMGVSQQTVSRWERGLTPVLPETLVRLSKLLEKDITYFYEPFRTRGAETPEHIPATTVPRRREADWPSPYEKAAAADENFHDSERQADNQAARRAA